MIVLAAPPQRRPLHAKFIVFTVVSFQGKQPFFAFLKGAASAAKLGEAAPAENYILDERVSDKREADFLSLSGFDTVQPATPPDWFAQHTNPHFFPAPESVSHGYGFTVDLDVADASWKREFLHAPIAYELRDIQRIGLVTTDVTETQIKDARKLHRSLLQADLKNFGDLP